jgi:tRNA/tmRNA/rRNA uracil-C5-methylase (TrmA/RlmC/RlmD family)
MSPGRSGYCYFDKIDLSKMKNKQIFYITCNEETMKKDIKDNFIIKNNIMIELFPGTIYNEHIINLSI